MSRVCDIAEETSTTKSGYFYREFTDIELTVDQFKDNFFKTTRGKIETYKYCGNFKIKITKYIQGYRFIYLIFKSGERLENLIKIVIESEDEAIELLEPISHLKKSLLYEIILNWIFRYFMSFCSYGGLNLNIKYKTRIGVLRIVDNNTKILEIPISYDAKDHPSEFIVEIAEKIDQFPSFLTEIHEFRSTKKAN